MMNSPKYWLFTGRAMFWAFLGAVAGLVASGPMWLYIRQYRLDTGYFDFILNPHQFPEPILVLPGLLLGFTTGLYLLLRGHARWFQAVAIIGGSSVAFYVATQIDYSFWFRGLVWAAVLSAATIAIFPFARRRGFWLTMTSIGLATALVIETLDLQPSNIYFPPFHVLHWTGWFMVHAAVLSLFIPIAAAAEQKTERTDTIDRQEKKRPEGLMSFAIVLDSLCLAIGRTWRRFELGAISGAAGWGLVSLIIWFNYFIRRPAGKHREFEWFRDWPDFDTAVVLIIPGLAYGVIVGMALWRAGLATIRQVLSLAAVSVAAQNCGFFTAVYVIHSRSLIWQFVFGFLVWTIVQVAGTAATFNFTRRLGLCFAMAAAGYVILWLPMVTHSQSQVASPVLAVYWMAWFGIITAFLVSALPTDTDKRPTSELPIT